MQLENNEHIEKEQLIHRLWKKSLSRVKEKQLTQRKIEIATKATYQQIANFTTNKQMSYVIRLSSTKETQTSRITEPSPSDPCIAASFQMSMRSLQQALIPCACGSALFRIPPLIERTLCTPFDLLSDKHIYRAMYVAAL